MLADHLGDRAAVAIGGLDLKRHFAANRQSLLQIRAGLLAVGALGRLGGIDAGQPHGERLTRLTHADGVAIADREDGGPDALSDYSRWPGQGCQSKHTQQKLLAIAGVCTGSLFMLFLHGGGGRGTGLVQPERLQSLC